MVLIIVKFGELFPFISLRICFEKLCKTQAAPRFFNLFLSIWISYETVFLVFDIQRKNILAQHHGCEAGDTSFNIC